MLSLPTLPANLQANLRCDCTSALPRLREPRDAIRHPCGCLPSARHFPPTVIADAARARAARIRRKLRAGGGRQDGCSLPALPINRSSGTSSVRSRATRRARSPSASTGCSRSIASKVAERLVRAAARSPAAAERVAAGQHQRRSEQGRRCHRRARSSSPRKLLRLPRLRCAA